MMSSDVSLHVGASRLQSIAKRQQSIAYINPNDGMEVTFQALSYSVKGTGGQQLHLLDNITGVFPKGEMCALMGASGSGKSTLLDLLAGRKTQVEMQGVLLMDGQRPTKQFLRRYVGYVEQQDTLIPNLTPYELLLYAAELKRPREEPLAAKQEDVERLLRKLKLADCRDTPIGSTMERGVSGGQAKRINIGLALITNPRLLLLDEPTSGLDAKTADGVMTIVGLIANSGITVCSAIHCPTTYSFSLFSSVMLLSKGKVVMAGGLAQLAALLEQSNLLEQLPDMTLLGSKAASSARLGLVLNAIDTVLDNSADEELLRQAYASSAARQTLEHDTCQRVDVAAVNDEAAEAGKGWQWHARAAGRWQTGPVTPWWWGLKTLFKYRVRKNYASLGYMLGRFGEKLVLSLLVVAVYANVGKSQDLANVTNLVCVLFMMVGMPAASAIVYLPSMVSERALFVRERSDGLYASPTYLLYKAGEELLLGVAIALVVTPLVFYSLALSGSVLVFGAAYMMTIWNGIAMAYMVASACASLDAASVLMSLVTMVVLYTAGLLMRMADMPLYISWISKISFLRHTFGMLMNNQFSRADPPYLTSTVLEVYGFKEDSIGANLGYAGIACAVQFAVAMLVTSFRRYQTR